VQDFPVFNGKYSTTCYIDETLHALNDMYEKRGLNASEYLQSLKTIFMHRPYRKMPETGYAIAYLFALGSGGSDALAELASYCYQAGVEPDQLLKEMMSQPQVAGLADPERHNFEAYPLTMAVFRIFRAARKYRREILDKLALGSDTMLDLGNLYTGRRIADAGLRQRRCSGSYPGVCYRRLARSDRQNPFCRLHAIRRGPERKTIRGPARRQARQRPRLPAER
jgi:hydroxymethylglutaryl-CoA synthase